MSENFPNEDVLKSFRQMLLDEARPELYRQNAFRVLGLPVRATEREIRKHLREMGLRREYGGGELAAAGRNVIPSPLPLSPSPNAVAVAEAQGRLARPERRFIDEFFWFWSNDVDALTALMKNDIETASSIWIKQTESPETRWVAVHDMAVMLHATALDIEWAEIHNIPVADELKQQRDTYWQNSIAIWRLTITREEVWEHLATRVGEVDDPRVTLAMVKELRAALPAVLLCVNARLTARASQIGLPAEVQRHKSIIDAFNFEEEILEEARRVVVEPLRQRIYDLCQTLEHETQSAPDRVDQPVQRVLKQSRPILIAINDLLPERDHRITDARDAVVASANDAALTKYRLLPQEATREWELAKNFFERLRVIAASASMRQTIKQNIEWAADHLPRQQTATAPPVTPSPSPGAKKDKRELCWFCMKREEDGFSEDVRLYKKDLKQNVYYHDDVKVPRCSGCFAIHSRAKNFSVWGGIAGVAVGLSVFAGALAFFSAQLGNFLSTVGLINQPILLLIGAAIYLFAFYSLGEWIVYKKVWQNISGGVKPIEHRLSFSRVADLQRQGWTHIKPSN